MKNVLLLFAAAATILGSGCATDNYPLDVEQYDVRWTDHDGSGSRTPADALEFVIRVNTTDPEPDNQYITQWALSYQVNGAFGGTLQSDDGIRSNSLNVDAIVGIGLLPFPGGGEYLPGDRIEFRFYAIDNWGEEVERNYTFTLEP